MNKCKSNSPGNLQRFCRFSGETPYVCCEKQVSNKLMERQQAVCGRKKSSGRSAAIIGGRSVENAATVPWMAAIGEYNINGEADWFCGGALVSAQTVITAAHCLGRRYMRTL